MMNPIILAVLGGVVLLLSNCASSVSNAGKDDFVPKAGRLGPDPDPAIRKAQIAKELKGNFYYGRRYYIHKSRPWGYVRKPGQPWSSAKLVVMDEKYKHQPDRYPENGPASARYGFDQNYEYRLYGSLTSKQAYDPNSNRFVSVFRLRGYKLVNKKPGWLFSRDDYYDPFRPTLRP